MAAIITRNILVTSALPYANGPIHLGHMVEYIQTDIWVRAMRAMGHQVSYVCADDAHGTAIMLKAEANGITPEVQIANVQQQHQRDFAGFGVGFDHYDSTHSPTNQARAEQIYNTLHSKGLISKRPVKQLYDPQKGLFLADRFVKGDCPKCAAAEQYGDSCDKCGATYNATELKNAVSVFSGAAPVLKESEHYFFKLSQFAAFLTEWTQSGALQSSIANKLKEWLDAGLADWDISRDAPYFGFEIPGSPGKYFYVWLDAPVGYMSSFENLCATRPDLKWHDYWQADQSVSQTELYHFIGKDIVNFHGLFWPAMLEGSGYRKPTGVFAHGHLMVNGDKMSKSKGTFITAESYLNHLNPEYLRYYFASKLGSGVEDLDLNLDDFMTKVNSDVVGKVVNIASRCAGFVHKLCGGVLVNTCPDVALIDDFIKAHASVAAAYEAREYSRVIREVMALADRANQYIDEHKPWQLAKDPTKLSEVHAVCSMGVVMFYHIMLDLAPIMPSLAADAARFLQVEALRFNQVQDLFGKPLAEFKPLINRVDPSKVAAMLAENEPQVPTTNPVTKTESQLKPIEKTMPTDASTIDINAFAAVQMVVGKICQAETVEGADKLLKLQVDIGEAKPRQIFSGIRASYMPAQLLGKMVIVVANLAPRKMRFGMSEGMVIAAGNGANIYLLSPDAGAQPGDIVS